MYVAVAWWYLGKRFGGATHQRAHNLCCSQADRLSEMTLHWAQACYFWSLEADTHSLLRSTRLFGTCLGVKRMGQSVGQAQVGAGLEISENVGVSGCELAMSVKCVRVCVCVCADVGEGIQHVVTSAVAELYSSAYSTT